MRTVILLGARFITRGMGGPPVFLQRKHGRAAHATRVLKPLLISFVIMSALLGCQSGPHPAPGLSAIQVKVVAEPKKGAAAPHVAVYDQGNEVGYGQFQRVDYADLQDIVVWIEPANSKASPPQAAAPATIDLDDRGVPSGVAGAASVGQKVMVRNPGPRPLEAYSVSDGNDFTLGTIPPNGAAEFTVKSEGLIEIVTSSLSDPLARIYAAPTSPVRLTHAGCTLDFNDLAPGHYRITCWHPRLPGSVQEVSLLADQVSRTTLSVSVNPLPKIDAK